MAGRKIAGGIRSGRIIAPTKDQKVIVVRDPTAYRIFNTGQFAFKVMVVDGSGATTQLATIDKRSSADIKVPDARAILIQAVAADKQDSIEGLYDLLDTTSPVRSGHFKSKTPTSPVTIARNRRGKLYRVYNSGEVAFTVKQGTVAANDREVQPGCSLDLYLAAPEISVTRSDNTLMSGVYDLLQESNPVRSGRFAIPKATSPVSQLIIDFLNAPAGGNDVVHQFRVTNGGDTPFVVLRDGQSVLGQASNVDIPLLTDQSVDFQIAQSELSQIVVKGAANEPFTGIYDYLGPAK